MNILQFLGDILIFWQKLANLNDVICAINLFSVKNRQKESSKW